MQGGPYSGRESLEKRHELLLDGRPVTTSERRKAWSHAAGKALPIYGGSFPRKQRTDNRRHEVGKSKYKRKNDRLNLPCVQNNGQRGGGLSCPQCGGFVAAAVTNMCGFPLQWYCEGCCAFKIRVDGSNTKKRAGIEDALSLMLEGMSMRGIRRMTGIGLNGLNLALLRYGAMAIAFENAREPLAAASLQLDELWTYVHGRSRHLGEAKRVDHAAGDLWVWTAIDPHTKALAHWAVGRRTSESAVRFIEGLRPRVCESVEIVTDGFHAYLEAIDAAFIEANHKVAIGGFNYEHSATTNHAEAHNKTMRTQIARLRRNSNANAKSVLSLIAHIGLYSLHYNYVRTHGTLKATPMMANGVTAAPWTFQEMLDMCEGTSADVLKTLESRFMKQAVHTPWQSRRWGADHKRDDPWRMSRGWQPRVL